MCNNIFDYAGAGDLLGTYYTKKRTILLCTF